jgi:propanol-preferring alcohol dehydrogenase
MRAWTTATAGVLQRTERPDPIPSADEVLVRVLACGVCRTDLHVIDQELPVRRPGVVPGHQAIGEVIGIGAGVRTMQPGDRVGVAWLRRTCGACRWCRDGRENLCPDSEYTGWDVDGGFADLVTVPEAFAYRVSSLMDPAVLAPLLCAASSATVRSAVRGCPPEAVSVCTASVPALI